MKQKPSYEFSQEEVAQVAQYVQGELGQADREAFEARMDQEPELRLKVTELKALIIGVREASLSQQLHVIHEGLDREASAHDLNMPGRTPMYRTWWVAVAALLVAVIGIWQLWFALPRHERLYEAYFVPDVGLPVEMGAADTVRYTFFDGMISYKEGNYADAIAKWETVASLVGASDTLSYYRGVAYMGLHDFDAALESLASVANERRSMFYEEATWYLALCYLQQGESSTAATLLRRIDNDEQAQSLLKKLR